MRFNADGPGIPNELVALQEKGDTVFICGAGVSRTAGLPSFHWLVESVYKDLGEDWRQHPAEREVMEVGGRLANQYDRLLRILERVLRQNPRAALRLANALIDPAIYPVPNDLADFLQLCVDADPSVTAESTYIRLFGLRRLQSA